MSKMLLANAMIVPGCPLLGGVVHGTTVPSPGSIVHTTLPLLVSPGAICDFSHTIEYVIVVSGCAKVGKDHSPNATPTDAIRVRVFMAFSLERA
jgi:hypothetical protein